MKSLQAFLQPITEETKDVYVSERFKEADGKRVAFVIRPITQDENTAIMRKNTRKDKKGNEQFDRMEYVNDLVAAAVVYPDLKSAELQKHYGVLGEAALLKKMLLVGEFANLSSAVQEMSGLDQDINEDIEEVKN